MMQFDPRIGIGLREPHIQSILSTLPAIGWLEVHSENWMTDEGPIAERLQHIRAQYPVSLHGVGMSLGSADGLDSQHLQKLVRLVERCQPILISEHLSWGRIGNTHSNDLLPTPFNAAAITTFVNNIDKVQQTLGRQILVENISSYCRFVESDMQEWEFICDIIERAQCGLLLDLNNLYVNACNHGFSADIYLRSMPWNSVGEIHLAGFEHEQNILIDTHGAPVHQNVWQLYKQALSYLPTAARTLIEWDTDLPPLERLLAEANTASLYLQGLHHDAA